MNFEGELFSVSGRRGRKRHEECFWFLGMIFGKSEQRAEFETFNKTFVFQWTDIDYSWDKSVFGLFKAE